MSVTNSNQNPAYLILADGSVFEGEAAGAKGEVIGEVVFTTAMVGYMETLTDPSYYGQIVTQTFPLIGNYGSIEADAESEKPFLSGYIAREFCTAGSNYRKDGEIDAYLKKHNIVAICGIDTRALTKKLRKYGVTNGMIAPDKDGLEQKIKRIKAFKIIDAVKSTTIKTAAEVGGNGKNVVLWDMGAKKNIDRELIKRGCRVTRVPSTATAAEILSLNPDGIMISNGAGDPAENVDVIKELKKLLDKKIPTFGICLGHQLLALASGGKTAKLKYGHRGANQPVKDLKTGRVYITSQNHGYHVRANTLDGDAATLRFVNANDNTCEGIDYLNAPAFSVQFHPEACGGPRDTEFLFDRFIDSMNEEINKKR